MMAATVKDDPRTVARRLRSWARAKGRRFAWRETRDPYAVLIAELLLQRTPFWKVARAYPKLLELAPTASALAVADVEQVRAIILPLGLPSRAQKFVELGRLLVERHGGRVPGNVDALRALPGVGRYVASAVQVFAFGRSLPLVDGLTGRFYRRVLGMTSKGEPHADADLWRAVADVQPHRPRDFHLAVIDLASVVCRLRRPLCDECPVASVCAFNAAAARTTPPANVRSRGRAARTA